MSTSSSHVPLTTELFHQTWMGEHKRIMETFRKGGRLTEHERATLISMFVNSYEQSLKNILEIHEKYYITYDGRDISDRKLISELDHLRECVGNAMKYTIIIQELLEGIKPPSKIIRYLDSRDNGSLPDNGVEAANRKFELDVNEGNTLALSQVYGLICRKQLDDAVWYAKEMLKTEPTTTGSHELWIHLFQATSDFLMYKHLAAMAHAFFHAPYDEARRQHRAQATQPSHDDRFSNVNMSDYY